MGRSVYTFTFQILLGFHLCNIQSEDRTAAEMLQSCLALTKLKKLNAPSLRDCTFWHNKL